MRSPRRRRPFWGTLALAATLAGAACHDLSPLGPLEPGEIRGRFIRFDGSAVINVPVRIGAQTAVTGRDGSFRITGVDVPYDLVIGQPVALVYEGVTRNDPIVMVPGTHFGHSHVAKLNGQVPAEPDLQALVFVTGADPSAPLRYVDSRTGVFEMEVFWDGRADVRYATLHALRRRGEVILDLAVRRLRLQDREEHSVALRPRDFAPVRSFPVAGSVQMPQGTQSYTIRMSMSIAGATMMLDGRGGSGSVTSFAFTAPVIDGSEFDVDVSTVRGGYSGFSYGQITGISPQTGPLALRLYDPPLLFNPPADAVVDDPSTAFTWGAGEGPGVYAFALDSSRGRTLLYTDQTRLSVTDLVALTGALQPGHGYSWSIHKLHAASSVDELLTLENRATLARSMTTARRFVFQSN